MGQADADHHGGAHAGGIDRASRSQAKQHHKNVVEDDIQRIAGQQSNARQLGVVVAVDEIVKRALTEHQGHQHKLRADNALAARPDLRPRLAGAEKGQHLGQKQQPQGAQDQIGAQGNPQYVGEDPVPLLRLAVAERGGVADGAADRQRIADCIEQHIDRLTDIQRGQARHTDNVSHKNAVRQPAHRQSHAGKEAGQEKAPKCFPDKNFAAEGGLFYIYATQITQLSVYRQSRSSQIPP
ncbi:hypothetical protein SDC9_98253 [bioreactor metagenome]|uniref:Uncharacterized protein n=1 Tax=bioreactor metagenome TaxID=1076179 RepID=A0A645APG6_9ZZZZ